MPELHSLTPVLAVLQDRGLKVALVTDGRMSGASGKVPSAIHVSPEARDGGPLARIRDGDLIRVDAVAGTLDVLTAASTRGSGRQRCACDRSPRAGRSGRRGRGRLRHVRQWLPSRSSRSARRPPRPSHEHARSRVRPFQPPKAFTAAAIAAAAFAASFAPPCAMSGRPPPPLPPSASTAAFTRSTADTWSSGRRSRQPPPRLCPPRRR
jgi:hypothetical protein